MPLAVVAAAAVATVATGVAPAAPAAAAADPAPASWTVRPGDSTYTIARRAGVTVQDVVAANRLPQGGRLIHPGQRLVVPVRAAAAVAPQATRQVDARAPKQAPKQAPAPRPAARPAPARPLATEQQQVRALIEQVAVERGVDPRLALAVGLQESGWRQGVTSHVGARGVMQVMPANQRWASQLAGRPLDLGDARDNVTAGVVILKQLQATAGGEDAAIGGYYQGLPSVTARGMYAETRRYVASVKAHRARM
ncbi:lytic transglycosylase domain-containing protein [Arsenicicoccus sp. oral taxon 190]|uniref:lytic transglycosylase domain-containing protein n=1 Tax=Arsenicicoccus sp. oral taxon 190 TaxID=1658671 RepID=UPI00067D29FD|nr:LysM peptidoglycan-binding domain-containing protein [Arsenicicoccus sp. oral taxon 190]